MRLFAVLISTLGLLVVACGGQDAPAVPHQADVHAHAAAADAKVSAAAHKPMAVAAAPAQPDPSEPGDPGAGSDPIGGPAAMASEPKLFAGKRLAIAYTVNVMGELEPCG